jgi:hypothetical protein
MAGRLLCTDVLSRIGLDVGRLTRSSAYDWAMRVPVVAWSSALALTSAAGLEQYIAAADSTLPSAVFAVEVTMRLSVIAYLVILAMTVVMRAPPIGRPRGAEPRISALIGTFLITTVVFFPSPAFSHRGALLLDPDPCRRRARCRLADANSPFVQHYARSAKVRLLGSIPLCAASALFGRGDRDNRRGHAVSIGLDRDAAPRANIFSVSADPKRGGDLNGNFSTIRGLQEENLTTHPRNLLNAGCHSETARSREVE